MSRDDVLGMISERFNATTGAFGYLSVAGVAGANLHPDRCECQGDDTTPHKHYRESPYHCGRCVQCNGFTPVNFPTHPLAVGGIVLTDDDWADVLNALSYAADVTPSTVYAQELDAVRRRIETMREAIPMKGIGLEEGV